MRMRRGETFRLGLHFEVEPVSGCWRWTGRATREGYGWVWWDGRARWAHRLSYELHVGPIPEGLVVDHLCGHPWCVNPEHLEPVTERENLRRRRSVLRPERVREIREMAATATQRAVARRFGVHQSTVGRIASGLTHADVR